LRTALTAAIDELPAAYRAVLVRRDIQGRSNAQIARDLGLSISVVKTRTHRARLFLRKRLDGYMTTSDAATATAAPGIVLARAPGRASTATEANPAAIATASGSGTLGRDIGRRS
jgi:Sigma-70, region 4